MPGSLANFTILADNPLTLDPISIKDIAIWGTVQEGHILPVRSAIGNEPSAVLGPVLDGRPTLAARKALERHEAAGGQHGDACGAARALSGQFGALD